MLKQLSLASIFLFALTTTANADIIVDFTLAGTSGTDASGSGFVFSTQDLGGTGVSFDITASAIIPVGGGANNGDVARLNGGLGSTVENTGGFINVIGGVAEEIEFTIGNVAGLASGESLAIESLLSQNGQATTADQSGGFGGAFGNITADSVTLTSDSGSSFVINQSDSGDLGSILLNHDNAQAANTGNTFEHLANDLGFTNSFSIALTDLTRNDAVVVQGFQFVVVPAAVPEPSSALLLGFGGLSALLRRRRFA